MVAGALPAFSSAGTVETSITLAGTFDVAVPAHTAGDLLILQVLVKNGNDDGTLASINTSGWAQLGGAGTSYGGTQQTRMGIGWKIGNGSESVVNVTTTGGTIQDRRISRVYRFTAADGFATTAVANVSTPSTGTATSFTMPTVDPGGALNRRAVALIGSNTNAPHGDSTAESGGDWAQPVASAGEVFGSMGIQTSDQSGGGAISGGTASAGGNANFVVVGFTLEPAEVGGGPAEEALSFGVVLSDTTVAAAALAEAIAETAAFSDAAVAAAALAEVVTEAAAVGDATVAEAALAEAVAEAAAIDDTVAEVVAGTVSLTEAATFEDVTVGASGPTPVADINIDAELEVDTTYLIRVRVENTGAAGATDFRWSYNHAAAGWLPITATSTEIKAVAATSFANDDDVPEVFGGTGTYLADNNAGSEDGTTTLGAAFPAGGAAEFVLAFQIVGADVSDAQTGQIRLELGDGADLDAYTNTFTYTVNVEAATEALTFALAAGDTATAVAAADEATTEALTANASQAEKADLDGLTTAAATFADADVAVAEALESVAVAATLGDEAVGDTESASSVLAALSLGGAQIAEADLAAIASTGALGAATAQAAVSALSGASTAPLAAGDAQTAFVGGFGATTEVVSALDSETAASALMEAIAVAGVFDDAATGDTSTALSVSFSIELAAAQAETAARVASLAEPMVAAVSAAELADFAAVQAAPLVVQIATENAVAGFADLSADVDLGSAQSSLVDLQMLLEVSADFGLAVASEPGIHNTVTVGLALASIMESTPHYIDPILGARFGDDALAAKYVSTDANLSARFQY